MEPPKRKAGRPPAEKEPEELGPTLKLTVDADRLLTAQAKNFKMSKRQYASAAVAFCAGIGIDPRKEAPTGLGEIGAKVSAETLAVRKQNVDIGNRFISIIRTWEANLYGFMKQQELAQNTYLAAIERNLLERMVAMETSVLGPMVEQIIKSSLEGYAARIVAERTYLKVMDRKPGEWAEQHSILSRERDQLLLKGIEEYIKLHPSSVATVTPKPALTPVPTKPVAPSAGTTPAPGTPAPAAPPKP